MFRCRRRTAAAAVGILGALASTPGGVARPAPVAHAAVVAPPSAGWTTLRRLDLLPLFTPGAASRQFSSYDRSGGNEDGQPNTCLRRSEDSGCVVAEQAGAGQIDSIWFTRDKGDVAKVGRLRIEIDGRTVVDAPLQSVVDGALGPPFVYPLVANAGQTSGGVYIKVPMPFRQSMRVSVDGEPLYYHVTYRTFTSPAGVPSFNPADRAADVLARLNAAGTRDPKPRLAGQKALRRSFRVAPGHAVSLARLEGPGAVTDLWLRFLRLSPPSAAGLLRDARLRITFDGRRTVDSPVGEFFGSGLLPAPVRSLLLAQSPGPPSAMESWWPMPFQRSAELSLVNASRVNVLSAQVAVSHAPAPQLTSALAAGRAGYFHATSRRGATVPGQPWTVLGATGRGRLVGISQTMQGNSNDYLEGDEQVFIDGSTAPQLLGTGTEDFYEGGFYFARGPFSAPFNGNPVRLVGDRACPAHDCTAAYRLLIADGIPFRSSLRFAFEHGPANSEQAVYGTTAYWYG